MKNIYKFLSNYSICPICGEDLFTEIMMVFGVLGQNSSYKLIVSYVRDMGSLNCFKYIKHRDDDDRKYDYGFDRSPVSLIISKNGDFIFDSNVFSPNKYFVSGHCGSDHFSIETKEVCLNLSKNIDIANEEFFIKNYKIVNDYNSKITRIYVDGSYSSKLNIKLNSFYSLKNNSASDIESKIESLLILL